MAHCIRASIDHVLIEGGDGTAQGVLTEFLRRKSSFARFPKFTLLPGGMTNQVAKTIGASPKHRNAITRLIEHTGTTSLPVPLLRVSSNTQPDLYGFLFSTGAVPMVTEYTKSDIHKRGIGGSAAVAFGILRAVTGRSETLLRKTPIDLSVSGPKSFTYKDNHLGTLVTTLPGLILSLDPFWGTERAPLRVIIAGAMTQKLLRNILSLWRGHKSKDRTQDDLQSVNADTLTYLYKGPIVLDGEFLDFNGQSFTVEATDPVEFIR